MTMVPTARTGSLKVRVTRAGTTAAIDPSAGEVPTRTSCAWAGAGVPITRAVAASAIASARARRRTAIRFGR